MTQFSTVKDLRDFLATLIADDLGEFGNGAQRIWVRPPDPPAGVASGLECIIQRSPEGELSGSSGGQKKDFREWIVSLTNFAGDGSLNSATEKIKSSDRIVFAKRPRYTPPSEDNYESIKFYVFDPTLLN